MKTVKRISCLLLTVVFSLLCLCSCTNDIPKATEPVTLNVSLYTFIPEYDSFEQTVKMLWNEKHPDIRLNFVNWDSYSGQVPDDLDVFVIDTINLDTFTGKGYLLQLSKQEIQDFDDLIDPAAESCIVNGNIVAIPQFLCTPLLYTRKDDHEFDDITNIDQLYDVLNGKELLTDDTEDGDTVCHYLQALNDEYQCYMDSYPLLEKDTLSEGSVNTLEKIRLMRYIESENESAYNGSYYYAQRFSQGLGRAYIGYSESMSAMDDPTDMNFRMFSMSDKRNIPVFYEDTAAINSKISDEKKPYAIEFLNMITGSDLLIKTLANGGDPLYLLSARTDVYEALEADYPIYGELKKIVSVPDAHIFRIKPDGIAYIDQAIRNVYLLPNINSGSY